MLGSNVVVTASKKGKEKCGWKVPVVADVLAFVGNRVAKKKPKSAVD